jgi:hypothetical protein
MSHLIVTFRLELPPKTRNLPVSLIFMSTKYVTFTKFSKLELNDVFNNQTKLFKQGQLNSDLIRTSTKAEA